MALDRYLSFIKGKLLKCRARFASEFIQRLLRSDFNLNHSRDLGQMLNSITKRVNVPFSTTVAHILPSDIAQ